jgi:uncharacterized protein (DUF1697 family)
MRTAVFLRGINVGGNKKISMSELRKALQARAYNDPQTLLQSGNVVLDKAKPADIEKVIREDFAMEVRVVTRSHAELQAIVTRNPFKNHEDQPSRLAVAFLDQKPSEVEIDPEAYRPDEFVIEGQEIYLWYPEGQASTKLLNPAMLKKLGVTATARNWNTVLKMVELTK